MNARDETFDDAVLGSRLRQGRLARGLTLKAVEASTGGKIPAAVLSSYERGEHSIPVIRLCRLADLYGISVETLTERQAPIGNQVFPEPLSLFEEAPVRLDVARISNAKGREVETVGRLVTSVQERRRSRSTDSIVLRQADLEIAAATLGKSMSSLLADLSTAGALRRPVGRPPKSP